MYHYSYETKSIVPGKPVYVLGRHIGEPYPLSEDSLQAYAGFLSNLSRLLYDVNSLIYSGDLQKRHDINCTAIVALSLVLQHNLLCEEKLNKIAFGNVFNYIIGKDLQSEALTDIIATYIKLYAPIHIRSDGSICVIAALTSKELYNEFQVAYTNDVTATGERMLYTEDTGIIAFFEDIETYRSVFAKFAVISRECNVFNCNNTTQLLFDEIKLRLVKFE